MKQLLFVLLALSTVIACHSRRHIGYTEHLLQAGPFDEVYVSGPCEVELCYAPDSVGMMVIRATSRAYDHIDKSHSTGRLYISLDGDVSADVAAEVGLIRIYVPKALSNVSVNGMSKVTLRDGIATAAPVVLSLGGAGEIQAAAVESMSLSVAVTGAGSIGISGDVHCEYVNCALTGSGKISVAGLDAQTMSSTLRGSGTLSVAGVAAENASVVVKGSGAIDAAALATPLLKAAVYGDGTVTYGKSTKCRASGKTENINKK